MFVVDDDEDLDEGNNDDVCEHDASEPNFVDDDERNSNNDVCSCLGNSDNFINCLDENDDISGDDVASEGSDDSACDDEDSNGDDVDDGRIYTVEASNFEPPCSSAPSTDNVSPSTPTFDNGGDEVVAPATLTFRLRRRRRRRRSDVDVNVVGTTFMIVHPHATSSDFAGQ
jgi:hypothetical protein